MKPLVQVVTWPVLRGDGDACGIDPQARRRSGPARERPAGFMQRLRPLGLALSLALAYPVAQGLPQGAQVVNGQVNLTPGLIQQGSDKAIVNWQSFSIGANETLRIQQPNVNSVLLNRVVGGDPSLILGQMQANGRVFLVNPRGIVFGRGSRVDAAGLVASTLDLSDTAFLAGNYRFSAGAGAGILQADGSIHAPGGTVVLVAPQLNASGSIAARRVGLAAASTVQVDVEGDGLVLFNLRNDDGRDVALKLSGRVQAESSVEARVQARAGAAGQVLNMDGIVQARGLRQQGGRVVIDGGTVGDTLVKGSLDASGDKGGAITVLGQRVGLMDGARLDASGRLGGGDIQIGGGFHGEGTAHNAQRSFIGANVQLRADATEQGDGGRVVIWADQRTDMLGLVWARGGRLGGNGGAVETSGREQLNMPRGGVDVSAPRGRAGQWLLDPYDLTIKDTGGGGGDVPGPSPFQSANNSAVLDVGVLTAALTTGNVVVQTGGGGNQAGNITVDGDIHAAGATGLSLIAQNAISFTGNGKIRATGTALDVSLQAGSGGVDTTAGSIDTHGGKLNVSASGAVSLGNVSSGDLAVTTTGAVSLSSVQGGQLVIDASGGSGNVVLPAGTLSSLLSVKTGGGNITQTAGSLTVGGSAILSSGVGSITLGTLSPSGKLDISTSSGDVSLGGGSVGGQLKFASTSGSLSQTGALNVSGGANINTGGTLTLNNASNNLGGTLDITAGATDLLNGGSNPLTLGTLNTGALKARTGGGLLTLGQGSVASLDAATTTGGNIVQGLTSLVVGGAANLSSGAGTVTLGNLSSTGNLDISSGSGDVSLGAVSVGGQLRFTSTGGSLSQTAALNVTGGANINIGGTVTLNHASNNLGGTLDITAGTTDLLNGGSNPLTLGTLNTAALKVRTGSGQLTLGQGSGEVVGYATNNKRQTAARSGQRRVAGRRDDQRRPNRSGRRRPGRRRCGQPQLRERQHHAGQPQLDRQSVAHDEQRQCVARGGQHRRTSPIRQYQRGPEPDRWLQRHRGRQHQHLRHGHAEQREQQSRRHT
jgi:filamentous hemagglutinin family protein